MKRLIPLLLVLLLPTAGAVEVGKEVVPIPPPTPPVDFKNLTKLVISPDYKNLRLKPGEFKSFTVKIKNPTNKDVLITPKVVIRPYSDYVVDKSWI